MLPLTAALEGEENSIKKIGGNSATRQFLETLGFVPGTFIKVVSINNGSLIVNIKESRVAIGREMAQKIIV